MNKAILVLLMLLLLSSSIVLAVDFDQEISDEDQQTFDQILEPVLKVYNFIKYATTVIAVLFLIFTFILLSTTVGLLIRYFIAHPISKLIEGTTMITAGNLDHQIPIEPHDEIGDLARSFNEMTSRLKASRQEI